MLLGIRFEAEVEEHMPKWKSKLIEQHDIRTPQEKRYRALVADTKYS